MQKDFSYPLKIEDIGQGEQNYKLKADKEQLEFIKDILQVPSVNSFEAKIKLRFRKKQGELKVLGEVEAEIGQISVISLEPFNKDYKTSFEITYDTNATYEQIKEQDVDIMADIPDIVINGEINLNNLELEKEEEIEEETNSNVGVLAGFVSSLSDALAKYNLFTKEMDTSVNKIMRLLENRAMDKAVAAIIDFLKNSCIEKIAVCKEKSEKQNNCFRFTSPRRRYCQNA